MFGVPTKTSTSIICDNDVVVYKLRALHYYQGPHWKRNIIPLHTIIVVSLLRLGPSELLRRVLQQISVIYLPNCCCRHDARNCWTSSNVQIPIDSQSMCVHYYCVLYCSMAIDIGCMITCVYWLTIVGNLVDDCYIQAIFSPICCATIA